VEKYPVVRFDCGAGYGWWLGRMERCGLLPGDEAAWGDQWLRYAEASGVDLTDLGFACDEDRAAFVRDVWI